jgi:4-hydroxy-3-polyprenylbenzoate decarboxylase
MPNPRTYTDLNEHLTALKKEGLLHIIDIPINKDKHLHPLVRWQFRGGITSAERKGFHFTNVTDGAGTKYGGSCAVGVLASNQRIYEVGMAATAMEIGPKWLAAMANPIPPRLVTNAECQEVVIARSEICDSNGLDLLPVPISTPGFDVAPYFTAGCWITKDPDTNIQNMGVYRGHIKSCDRIGVMMEMSTLAGGYVHWKKYQAAGQRMPVALVLGAPPIVEFTGPQKLPLGQDELGVAGALAGGAINVVRCKSVDLVVPAEAQAIIEGWIDTDILEPEGPFGESHGYMQIEEYNFVMHVETITFRRNPIITSMISQVTPSESSVIKKLAYEPIFLDHLRNHLNIKSVQRISMHEPLTNLRKVISVVLDRNVTQTEVWRALQGLSSLQPAVGKICVAVNEDIDPDNSDQLLWAIAYRANPVSDIQILNYRSPGHVPRTASTGTESTLFIDATLKSDFPPVALPKKEFMEEAKLIWEQLGLPPLHPETPWHGYDLGQWCQEWDEMAAKATAGNWKENGARALSLRTHLDDPQAEAAGIIAELRSKDCPTPSPIANT